MNNDIPNYKGVMICSRPEDTIKPKMKGYDMMLIV